MHKNGQRVEFSNKGVKLYGTFDKIQRGKALVIGDDGTGYSASELFFRLSDRALPANHPSRKFAKNDRIEFEGADGGSTVHGTVQKNVLGLKLVVAGDDGTMWNVMPHKARVSKKPRPKGLVSEFAKGDRVEFDEKKKVLYGVVTKGGSGKVRVMMDGGKMEMAGPVSAFRKSDHPLLTHDSHPMDRWSVSSYKLHESMSEETPCFEAIIARNGKPVIHASNRGTGGCDMFHPAKGQTHSICQELDRDAKAWAASFGVKDAMEVADLWVEWVATKKPYGVTAKEFLKDYSKMLGDDDEESPSPRP